MARRGDERGDAIAVEGLTVRFGTAPALDSVSVRIPSHELTAVVGPPGCGKTTLLKALSCELPGGSGKVLIEDVAVRLWPEKKRSACVFTSFPRNCSECSLGLAGECSGGGAMDTPGLARALDLLGLVHLQHRTCSSLPPRDVSRLLLAAAIAPFLVDDSAKRSAHLWLDDPLDGLDGLHAHRLLQWLRDTAPARQTTVVTLTDHGCARSYADHVVLLRSGRLIAAGAPASALSSKHLTAAFGGR